jgi:hypothetical protein
VSGLSARRLVAGYAAALPLPSLPLVTTRLANATGDMPALAELRYTFDL